MHKVYARYCAQTSMINIPLQLYWQSQMGLQEVSVRGFMPQGLGLEHWPQGVLSYTSPGEAVCMTQQEAAAAAACAAESWQA